MSCLCWIGAENERDSDVMIPILVEPLDDVRDFLGRVADGHGRIVRDVVIHEQLVAF